MYDYEKINNNLTTKYIGQTFVQFESLSSIHTKAKNISENCPNGMLVLAENQDDIKLKNSRQWYCQNTQNLFMSIILKNNKDCTTEIIQIANAAVCESLLQIDNSLNCHIKWPNDIYINDKKICSVFSEKLDKKDNDSLIVSIYLNILSDDDNIVEEINDNYICLANVYSGEIVRECIVSNILNRIEIYYDELQKSKAMKSALSVFKNHNQLLGKNIGVRKINKKTVRDDKAIDINNNGDLVILDKNNAKDVLRYCQDTIEWWIDEQQVKN